MKTICDIYRQKRRIVICKFMKYHTKKDFLINLKIVTNNENNCN